MHDLKYAGQILDRLRKELKGKDKNTRVAIDVYLSTLSHVTPERLKEVFAFLSKEEGYGRAVLNISIAQLRIKCKKCGHEWKTPEPVFECPKCSSPDFELEKWEEFYIDSVKIG